MRAKLLLTLLLGLLSLVAYGQAEDPQLRREVQAYYARVDAIMAAADCPAMLKMMDPSFVMVDKEGKSTTYAQCKAMMVEMARSMKDPKSKTTVKRVERTGNEVVAWVESTMTYKMKDGSKWTPVRIVSRWAETLKKTATGWKSFYAQELPTNEPWNFGG